MENKEIFGVLMLGLFVSFFFAGVIYAHDKEEVIEKAPLEVGKLESDYKILLEEKRTIESLLEGATYENLTSEQIQAIIEELFLARTNAIYYQNVFEATLEDLRKNYRPDTSGPKHEFAIPIVPPTVGVS